MSIINISPNTDIYTHIICIVRAEAINVILVILCARIYLFVYLFIERNANYNNIIQNKIVVSTERQVVVSKPRIQTTIFNFKKSISLMFSIVVHVVFIWINTFTCNYNILLNVKLEVQLQTKIISIYNNGKSFYVTNINHY